MKKSMVGAKIKTPGMLRHVDRLMLEFGLGRMSVSALVFLYRHTSRRGDWTHEVRRFNTPYILSAKTTFVNSNGVKEIEIKLVKTRRLKFEGATFRVQIHRVMGPKPHWHQMKVQYSTIATAHSRNIRRSQE